ncbi:MAG: hypothetical protein H6974_02135 [Gammaproteobacteria bacterium]|nr:hypothetical protein [Gammaproteobacteria bacterium]MCP5195585.1 hypothetical protein [Gammaproteobacteria bacterium]
MNALMRRWRSNLGWFLLVCGLAGLALFAFEAERSMVAPLLGTEPTQIEHIEVLRSDREKLAFVRRDGRWWVTSPSHGPANPILLNQLLQEATAHCPRQYPVAEVDLKALSLNPPRLRLRLNDQEIRFGGIASVDGLRYVQTATMVHLCSERLYRLLSSAAASFLVPPIASTESPDMRDE